MDADVFRPDAALLPLLPPEDRALYAIGLDTSSQPDVTMLVLHGGDFSAYKLAERLMKDAGFVIGQSCAHQPTSCMFGDWDWVAKWRNLTPDERRRSHAILRGDHRLGPISISLTAHCPSEGRYRFIAAASDLEGIC